MMNFSRQIVGDKFSKYSFQQLYDCWQKCFVARENDFEGSVFINCILLAYSY